MSKGWSGGSTRAWRKIRKVILDRDHWICRLQIEGVCIYRANSVHHTKGKQFGDDPKHLVAACLPCNQHIGDPTASTYRGGRDVHQDPEPRPSTLL